MKSISTILFMILPAFISGFSPAFVKPATTALKAADGVEVTFGELDGTDVRVGIIKTKWNKVHVDNVVNGAKDALKECNVTEANIFETEVPGAYELPFAAKMLALSGTVDVVICAGVLIKGGTMHFEYICDAVSSGIMNVGLQTNVPVIFGVLTCLTEEQVVERSTGDNNHGDGWGKTAVEMALLRKEALGIKTQSKGPIGFDASLTTAGDGSKEKVGFF